MKAYQKPEVTVLGDATALIQGSKLPPHIETGSTQFQKVADFELDD